MWRDRASLVLAVSFAAALFSACGATDDGSSFELSASPGGVPTPMPSGTAAAPTASAAPSAPVPDAGAAGADAGTTSEVPGAATKPSDAGSTPADAATSEPDAGTTEADASANDDAGVAMDASMPADTDAGPPPPACKKHLTVVFSVGVGAGAAASHSNGCWNVVDADGAANHQFRKCSTSNFVVKNPSAPNYAYDDTNPSRPYSQDASFLSACSNGAAGDGYEFLAYRSGWRLIHATHLRAYFAELYGDALDDVDSLAAQSGVWPNAPEFAGHTGHVFPMINIAPPKSANLAGKVGSAAKKLCGAIADGGYFGTYVATWQDGLPKDDPRLVAFANAMNACTGL